MPPSRQVSVPKLFNAVRTLRFIYTARCLELINIYEYYKTASSFKQLNT